MSTINIYVDISSIADHTQSYVSGTLNFNEAGTGPTGPTGPEGIEGPEGPQGPQGIGPTGLTGSIGEPGFSGDQGPQGPTGSETGPTGDQGDQGPTGPVNNNGITGPQGNQGNQGATGAQNNNNVYSSIGKTLVYDTWKNYTDTTNYSLTTGFTCIGIPKYEYNINHFYYIMMCSIIGTVTPSVGYPTDLNHGISADQSYIYFTLNVYKTYIGMDSYNNRTFPVLPSNITVYENTYDIRYIGGVWYYYVYYTISIKCDNSLVFNVFNTFSLEFYKPTPTGHSGYTHVRVSVNGYTKWDEQIFYPTTVFSEYDPQIVPRVSGTNYFGNNWNDQWGIARVKDFFNIPISESAALQIYNDINDLYGPAGPTGATGAAGPTGNDGITGPTGISATGPTGPQGEIGPQGIQGIIGPTGNQGLQGIQGITGPTGIQGIQGIIGPTGNQGIQGIIGPTGITGEIGPTGDNTVGVQGPQGETGPTGPTGTNGEIGLTGATGATGVRIISGILNVGNFGLLPQNDDGYLLTNFSYINNETFAALVINSSSSLKLIRLTASVSDQINVGEYIIITVRKNNADTLLSLTLNNSTPLNNSGTLYIDQDLVNQISISHKDKITIRYQTSVNANINNLYITLNISE